MSQTRQQKRRELFQVAFAGMPLWETWTTAHDANTGFLTFDYEPLLETFTRHHCKPIPRRVRRSMARDRAHREWRLLSGAES